MLNYLHVYYLCKKNLMRKLFFMILTACGILIQSQIQRNPFRETEQEITNTEMSGPGDNSDDGTLEGDDPLPVSVDNYVPLLLTLGMALIVAKKGPRKNKRP